MQNLNWDPPVAPRAARISEAEWETHRGRICALHGEGKTLVEIISIVKDDCIQNGSSFHPSRKQYVSQLKKWKLQRYGLQTSIEEGDSADQSTPSDCTSSVTISEAGKRFHSDGLKRPDSMTLSSPQVFDPLSSPQVFGRVWFLTDCFEVPVRTQWPLQTSAKLSMSPNLAQLSSSPDFPSPAAVQHAMCAGVQVSAEHLDDSKQAEDVAMDDGLDQGIPWLAWRLSQEAYNQASGGSLQFSSSATYAAADVRDPPILPTPYSWLDQKSDGEPLKSFSEKLRCDNENCRWCKTCSLSDSLLNLALDRPSADVLSSDKEFGKTAAAADFFLAAGSRDDATVLYKMSLYRSQDDCTMSRLLTIADYFQANSTATPEWFAKEQLRLTRPRALIVDWEHDASTSGLWLQQACSGIVFFRVGNVRDAGLCIRRAFETCELSSDWLSRNTRQAWTTLLFDLSEKVYKRETFPGPSRRSMKLSRVALFPYESMRALLDWCGEKLTEELFDETLSPFCANIYNKVPNFVEQQRMENISMFCFLWQRYCKECAKKSSRRIDVILRKLEETFQISKAMLLSTICAMVLGFQDTVAFPALSDLERLGSGLGRARKNLASLRDLTFEHKDKTSFQGPYVANKFFRTYATLTSPEAGREILTGFGEWHEYPMLVQTFIRNFFALSSSLLPMGELPGVYETSINEAPVALTLDQKGRHKSQDYMGNPPRSGHSRSTTPAGVQQHLVSSVANEHEQRPNSSASTDILLNTRWSLAGSVTSSTASMRSLQRRIAERLLKRGDSGADQAPSDFIETDRSSWSFRRLTGMSYLSSTGDSIRDELQEQDNIMEDVAY